VSLMASHGALYFHKTRFNRHALMLLMLPIPCFAINKVSAFSANDTKWLMLSLFVLCRTCHFFWF
jgi:hypothetical protein